MATHALPFGHPMRAGFIGSYGNRWANHALGKCDFLLVVGSRLDIRQTGADTKSFGDGKVIFHVDCDAGEINNRVTGCRSIVSHVAPFFETALEAAKDSSLPDWGAWLDEIESMKREWPDTKECIGIEGINPNELMHRLSKYVPDAAVYSVDVGQHQMWAAQSLELGPEQRMMTSGGMGAMGFSLPAAIGASFACPNQPIVAIAGDGAFQLNIQELQTVVRNRLPIKIVVLNNRCHGMVRQFQESYFDSRYQSTQWGYSAPDFAAVAKAYGIGSASVSAESGLADGLDQTWNDPNEPFLLEVAIDGRANAYPKLAFGKPITEMEPLAKPVEMEST
jgi:acetolactate synthase-1/2/3 large subunit